MSGATLSEHFKSAQNRISNLLHWFVRSVVLVGALSAVSGQLAAQTPTTLSQPTQDALLHVVAHEMGHAILREFDLPILGPEEDIADDFATLFIYTMFPDRAEAIIIARADQNLADGEQPDMFSEYRNDAQRAGRSVCLLYGQNPEQFEDLANRFRLEGGAAESCRDFPTEIARSWRRTLARPFATALATEDWLEDAYTLMSAIDWHSRIVLELDSCDGSSSWSRNGRRIRICDQYIERFENQLAE